MTRHLSDKPEKISAAAYWELLMNLTRREVKGRFSQSFFGAGWAIAQPLATMAVFTLVFARLGQMPSDGAPYPLFAYAALAPWFFFSNSVNSGTMSLVTYRNIVTKTYFPREIVPLAQVCSRLVDFAAAASLYAVLMIYYGAGIGRWGALVPLFFLLLLLFTLGVTLGDVGAERVLSRRQPRRADQPAALVVCDADRVPAFSSAGAVSVAVPAQPVDWCGRRPACRARLRPRA